MNMFHTLNHKFASQYHETPPLVRCPTCSIALGKNEFFWCFGQFILRICFIFLEFSSGKSAKCSILSSAEVKSISGMGAHKCLHNCLPTRRTNVSKRSRIISQPSNAARSRVGNWDHHPRGIGFGVWHRQLEPCFGNETSDHSLSVCV